VKPKDEGKDSEKGVRKGVCVEEAAAVTVVAWWGRWQRARCWEQWQGGKSMACVVKGKSVKF
jgi:hypothetical protein